MANEIQEKGIAILPCTCPHEYQDNKYGKGRRVHNPKKGGGHTCTVCGKQK